MLTGILLEAQRSQWAILTLHPSMCSINKTDHQCLPKMTLCTHLAPHSLQLLPKGQAPNQQTLRANRPGNHQLQQIVESKETSFKQTQEQPLHLHSTDGQGKNVHIPVFPWKGFDSGRKKFLLPLKVLLAGL